MNIVLPSEAYVVEFHRLASFSKDDWLMCSACGGPQYLFVGCCFDPDCDPHVFRVDWGCVHCGHPLTGVCIEHYDVNSGKQQRTGVDWQDLQFQARLQYAEVLEQS